ncbi:MAG: hypothetical protein ACFFBC_00125 [Promethearchaeota archaeon]
MKKKDLKELKIRWEEHRTLSKRLDDYREKSWQKQKEHHKETLRISKELEILYKRKEAGDDVDDLIKQKRKERFSIRRSKVDREREIKVMEDEIKLLKMEMELFPKDFQFPILRPQKQDSKLDRWKKRVISIEKEINPYITLKLIDGKTFIYVDGMRFLQCIRLALDIPKEEVPLYDEVESIDEAAKLYNKHLFQNRIVEGPQAVPLPNQTHDITPEQEFWGHCSNIQTWVEYDYDTRILMSNVSFPLLRALTRAGDAKAKKVYKEEIVLRIESGYPSVIQYLLHQRYIEIFSPNELKTILETTNLVKHISESNMLVQLLGSCLVQFPTLLEDILVKILRLPENEKNFSSIYDLIIRLHIPSRDTSRDEIFFSKISRDNLKYLSTLKKALENISNRFNEEKSKFILSCLKLIDFRLKCYYFPRCVPTIPSGLERKYLQLKEELKNLRLKQPTIPGFWRCSYCGRAVLDIGQNICIWCGHEK